MQIFTHADKCLGNNGNLCAEPAMDTMTLILIAFAALLLVVWMPMLAVSIRRAWKEIKRNKR